ncbi:dodecin domain-containing protein [Flavobacterium sp. RSP49]|uniref:dodecin family protein n=1 Tax=Flavobacterium sp. RSP49 TaxID=2497487 RepID=UPI000F818939|nr:dodecin family protein [Flavobacterium sp. RSP49]RTZ00321.1 dodecin domain-containing protein [Flavobacterium sp. RSP49]
MSILKVIEILCSSKTSWQDGAQKGIAKAWKSVKHVRSVYVHDQSATVSIGFYNRISNKSKINFRTRIE